MTNDSSRRDFLKNSSAVLLAAQALGSHRLYAAAPMKKLNIAIIGCGGIMGTHVKGLAARKDEVTIPWLCDVDP
ncbi:MAG: twin-arginine translocation signal domain-containing protein, partial [Planctomycetaceae bacterium]|nr:twin-arginine translocation signal domain-containing protein [Planctomycetaceae bacterium]